MPRLLASLAAIYLFLPSSGLAKDATPNLNRGSDDKTLNDCNAAIRRNPNDAFAYTNRGVIWGNKGDFDKAISDFDQALRLHQAGHTLEAEATYLQKSSRRSRTIPARCTSWASSASSRDGMRRPWT